MRSTLVRSIALVVAGVAMTACSDSATTAPVADSPARLVVVSGNGQTLTVAGAASDTLGVAVFSSNGAALAGVTVTWSVSAGEGALSATSTTTDAQGIARTTLRAGKKAGTLTITATAAGSAGADFIENVTPDAPMSIGAMSMVSDTVDAGEEFIGVVQVVDQYGNNVPDAVLSVSLENAGADDFVPTSLVTTDHQGHARAPFVAGTSEGSRSLVFALLDGSHSVRFSVSVTAPTTASGVVVRR